MIAGFYLDDTILDRELDHRSLTRRVEILDSFAEIIEMSHIELLVHDPPSTLLDGLLDILAHFPVIIPHSLILTSDLGKRPPESVKNLLKSIPLSHLELSGLFDVGLKQRGVCLHHLPERQALIHQLLHGVALAPSSLGDPLGLLIHHEEVEGALLVGFLLLSVDLVLLWWKGDVYVLVTVSTHFTKVSIQYVCKSKSEVVKCY